MNKVLHLLIFFVLISCKKDVNQVDKIVNSIKTDSTFTSVEDNVWNGFPKKGLKIEDFIKNSEYEIIDTFYGNINNDNKEDAVVLIRTKGDNKSERILLVLLKQNNNSYLLFSKNETIMGPEFTESDYKIHDTEDISIKNNELKIDLYGSGPVGTTNLSFGYSDKDLMLLDYGTFNMGAGSHLETAFDGVKKIATVTVTNTMLDSMPTETEEIILNYKSSLLFSKFEIDKLNDTILKNTKLSW